MGDLKNYYPDQISLVVCGIPVTKGYADGSFVTVEQTSPSYTTVVGTDGEVTRTRVNDGRCTITLRTMQSADINAVLSALANLDRKATGGAGVGPTSINDLSGTSTFFAEKSWIAKPPKRDYDKTAKEREWVIECADHTALDGGN
jgi:hypothetical protein